MKKEKVGGYLHSDARRWTLASKTMRSFLKGMATTDQFKPSHKYFRPSGINVIYPEVEVKVVVYYLDMAENNVDMVEDFYVPNSKRLADRQLFKRLPHPPVVYQTNTGSEVTTQMWLADLGLFKRRSHSGDKTKARLTGPVQFINKLLEAWQLDPEDAVPLLGREPSEWSYVSNLLNGHTPLKGRDTKDRIAYLFRIRKTLSVLFLTEQAENKWLREQHAALGGQTPMQRLLEGSMENLLLVKEFVEEAAGR